MNATCAPVIFCMEKLIKAHAYKYEYTIRENYHCT